MQEEFHGDPKVAIGLQIKQARKSKGLTQKELGDRLGITNTQVAKYESGRKNLTTDILHKIATELQITFHIGPTV
jgi:HTH-type transcriptional regulator/antitoxin HipB